jgi:HAD superfamily hydrolase (TIGR01509 family)
MMSWLKQRGIKVGVATNSIRQTSVTMLGYAGIFELIDVLVTNEDVTKPKPDPEIYIKTMKILGVDADRTLVVEDHEVGVQSAQAAGCRVVQVLGVDDVGVPLLEPYFKSVTEGGKN